MIVRQCDFCGKDISYMSLRYETSEIEIKRASGARSQKMDICKDCILDFYDFVKERRKEV